jgi:hypothetical protein
VGLVLSTLQVVGLNCLGDAKCGTKNVYTSFPYTKLDVGASPHVLRNVATHVQCKLYINFRRIYFDDLVELSFQYESSMIKLLTRMLCIVSIS